MSAEDRAPRSRLLVLLALWGVPVLVLALVIPIVIAREGNSLSPASAELVVVGSRESDHRTSVAVDVRLGVSPEVRTQVAGVLTSVAAPGDAVTSGAELFRVDGVPVVAFQAERPLHRDLRSGARGEDVTVLNEFLVELSLLEPERADDRFGAATAAAVRGLQERLGVTRDGVFRLEYVGFVPEGVAEVGELVAGVGSVVGPGEVVLRATPMPLSLEIRPSSQEASLRALDGQKLVLRLAEDRELALDALTASGADAVQLYGELRSAVGAGALSRSPGESPDTERFDGAMLATRDVQTWGAVPTTAVHVGDAGVPCVIVPGTDSGGLEPMVLDSLIPAQGELGVLYVDPALIDAQVVRDVATVPEEVRAQCTST